MSKAKAGGRGEADVIPSYLESSRIICKGEYLQKCSKKQYLFKEDVPLALPLTGSLCADVYGSRGDSLLERIFYLSSLG